MAASCRFVRRAFAISEPSLIIETRRPDETRQWGERIGRGLRAGDVVALVGDLGTGKTTLTQGIAHGLDIDPSSVKSPSFVLMKEYRAGRVPLYHSDLYRLEGFADVQRVGYEEYLESDGVAVIEWAEKLETILPVDHLRVELEHVNDQTRQLTIRAVGARYAPLVDALSARVSKRITR